ncbi:MAG: radical SAM protein [Candidatus Zambryskibacteria bacterium]|nr:radical SAM protein [Candidatus Zambryskibacteria bacterium]
MPDLFATKDVTMEDMIVRDFGDASFITNRATRKSAFFEGPLASQATHLVGKPSYRLPDSFLDQFCPEDRSGIRMDFVEIRKVVLALSNELGNESENGDIPAQKTALEELSAYAIRKWQLINTNLELTYLCNQRCSWCYLDDFQKEGLSRERIQGLAQELRLAGVVFVLLTGGELFLRKDAIFIAEDLEETGFVLELKTNGTALSPSRIERLACLRPYDIQVSVYETQTGYSELTKSVYRFDRLVENVRQMLQQGLPVTLSVLVGKHNIDRIDEIHEALTGVGAPIFYSPYITPNRGGSGKEVFFRLSRREMEEKFKPFLGRISGFPSQKKYRDCRNRTACFAGRDQIAIDPQGVVYPCLDLRIPLGDTFSESLTEILSRRKQLLTQFSLREMQQCMSCRDRNYCDSCIGLALIENDDYRIPSRHKCDVVRFYAHGRR